ncbi:hypothetical protein FHS43_006181 [Streptosporangium becharense]|uniref:Uncharacterized protein n=1 Tax=Streptosporangium becharense TaxID=1816182 RepID=A0A7W9IGH3_9ACTN|nr:hypothetical protein [Streptosporangium becharense]MBB2914869.1 hypothetical protein [Streptosporangium becharense]MBB5820320.1 hypothetical protein [Streptosporangium becharense]
MNLADLYDAVPLVIRLVGGYHDGERCTVRDRTWPPRWRMPGAVAPVRFTSFDSSPVAEVQRYPTYAYTDFVNDHGERVYRYIGLY